MRQYSRHYEQMQKQTVQWFIQLIPTVGTGPWIVRTSDLLLDSCHFSFKCVGVPVVGMSVRQQNYNLQQHYQQQQQYQQKTWSKSTVEKGHKKSTIKRDETNSHRTDQGIIAIYVTLYDHSMLKPWSQYTVRLITPGSFLLRSERRAVHISYTGKISIRIVRLQLDHNASRTCNHNALRHLTW